MKLYLGVTDNKWYSYLSKVNPEDVNFWQPGGSVNFRSLSYLEPFLFKLKSPLNVIGGVGFFSSHTFLPLSVAWDVFGNRNGCETFDEFSHMILNYRQDKVNINPTIGCIVLTNPVFFMEEDWFEVPTDWSKSIVQGKSYDGEGMIGRGIWTRVNLLLEKYAIIHPDKGTEASEMEEDPLVPLYGNPAWTRVRIGQGAFRVLVTDAYSRKCSITGEKTLPVLEAAHIQPYAEAGPHRVSNGILLRSDMHKLFDGGYLTITRDLKVEVSHRIKSEFENGREYYQYHGKSLLCLPGKDQHKPSEKYIDWHNTNTFRG